MITVTDDKLDRAMTNAFGPYKTTLVDGTVVYSTKELTKEQIGSYNEIAQEGLNAAVENISKEIDRRIIEELSKKYGYKKRK